LGKPSTRPWLKAVFTTGGRNSVIKEKGVDKNFRDDHLGSTVHLFINVLDLNIDYS
jgi:hypothetical protein